MAAARVVSSARMNSVSYCSEPVLLFLGMCDGATTACEQDMTGPGVPTAMREAHLQTMFDILTERARVAWALKQRV